jgi:hypothetical protein
MPLDPFGQAYLTLALEIARHVDGYVDAYYGPPDLKASVDASPRKTPAVLLDDLARVRDLIPQDDPSRRDYLTVVLRAMDCTLRMLNGEEIAYLDEVSRLYDIQVAKIDEAEFETVHRALDGVLPGSGALQERIVAWRGQYIVPVEKLERVFEVAIAETRERTRKLIDLAEDEGVTFRLTSGQPWAGYNWYQGGMQSLVEVNTDVAASALDVAPWATHEAYPGHHTEHHLKEKHLYLGKGRPECACILLLWPAAVISEGIATTAMEIIFPNGSNFEWTTEVILPEAGLPPAPGDQLKQIGQVRAIAKEVSNNAAIMYNQGQMTEEQTVDYIRTYALVTEKRARQSFAFISNPLYRSYPFTYTEGYNLIAKASHGGDKTPLFKRLLVEETLPSSLS